MHAAGAFCRAQSSPTCVSMGCRVARAARRTDNGPGGRRACHIAWKAGAERFKRHAIANEVPELHRMPASSRGGTLRAQLLTHSPRAAMSSEPYQTADRLSPLRSARSCARREARRHKRSPSTGPSSAMPPAATSTAREPTGCRRCHHPQVDTADRDAMLEPSAEIRRKGN